MSAPPRGPRGGRGSGGGVTRARASSRGRGRGGVSSRPQNGDGNESDSGRRSALRGRGRGTTSHTQARGFAQAFQQATRQQSSGRGGVRTRGGSRSSIPTLAQTSSQPPGLNPAVSRTDGLQPVKGPNHNESLQDRFERTRKEREKNSHLGQSTGEMGGSSANLMKMAGMVGMCRDMCPEYERARRILQRDVHKAEKTMVANPDGTTSLEIDEAKMVKKFMRSAAGIDAQQGTDLRPPEVLQRTTNYLFDTVLSSESSLLEFNSFIWDRTRGIRNDFSIQQVKKIDDIRIAIECFEKIVRYHILSMHQVGTKPKEVVGDNYNLQQDREQFDKTLLSLLKYYEKVKKHYHSPNEAEFLSYWIVFQIGNRGDPGMEDKVQSWPPELLQDKRIQIALELHATASEIIWGKGPFPQSKSAEWPTFAIAQQNWQRFWNLVGSKRTSYLLSCVAEINFNRIRGVVLTAVSIAFQPAAAKKDIQDWTMDKMAEILAFDDEEQAKLYIEKQNLTVAEQDDGTQYYQLSIRNIYGLPEPEADMPEQFQSWHLVERKRFGRSWSALISGMSFKTAKEHGLMSSDWADEVKAHSSHDDGLFIRDEAMVDDSENASTAVPPAPSNPFGLTSKPADRSIAAKASNPFGTPSPFGQPSGTSPFAQATPSAIASPAPNPSRTPASTAPVGFKTDPLPGSFGALPKAFSFSTSSAAAVPAAVPATTSVAPSNPFGFPPPAKSSETKLVDDANPFSFPKVTTPAQATSAVSTVTSDSSHKPASESSQTGSILFAGLGGLGSSKKPEAAANPFAAPVASRPEVPTVQVTPPQVDPSTFKIGQTGPSSVLQSALPPTNKDTSPATFELFKPSRPEGSVSSISKPFTAPSFAAPAAAPQQPTPQAPNHTKAPLPALNPTTSTVVPGVPSSVAGSSQANTKKRVAFAPHSDSAVNSPRIDSVNTTWEHTRKSNVVDYLAERLVCDAKQGLLQEYFAHIIGPLVKKEMQREEERQKKKALAQKRARYLSLKFGTLWKRNTVMLRSRRKRLDMKKRHAEVRQRKLEKEQENSKGIVPATMSIEDEHALFKTNEERKRKEQEEEMAARLRRAQHAMNRPAAQHSAQTSATNSFDLIEQRHIEHKPLPINIRQSGSGRGHQRSQTQPNVLGLRNGLNKITKSVREASPALSASSRSSITRASLINGGSIVDSGLEVGKRASTMQSPYFRLKAAGFGSSLRHGFTASTNSGVKRPRFSGDDLFSGSSVYDDVEPAPASKRLRSPADLTSFSSPVRPPTNSLGASFASSTSSNGACKRLAEDEDLLARARRLREALEESESFYRDEIKKDELRRSQELRQSQLVGSRSSSQNGSPTTGPNGEDLSKLPKFYSRVSRFVLREDYGKRKEKQITTDLKGKEKVNGSWEISNGTNTNKQQMPPPPPPPKVPSGGGTSWDDAIEL